MGVALGVSGKLAQAATVVVMGLELVQAKPI
jgi:hypothetical protein